MSLQKRLTWLLVAFAGFSIVASFGTIYAVQLYVARAAADLDLLMDRSHALDHLRLTMRDQCVRLHESVAGLREVGPAFQQQNDQLIATIRHEARFARHAQAGERLAQLATALEEEFAACTRSVQEGRRDEAAVQLASRINGEVVPAIESCLRDEAAALDTRRLSSVDKMFATNSRVLILSLIVGVTGAALVVIGTTFVRRWIILPIRDLEHAAQAFGAGNLEHRVHTPVHDELGALGDAMNGMAASLAQAEADVRESEVKYRTLFENLRDAAIICTGDGQVVECHKGDMGILDSGEGAPGAYLLECWPGWRTSSVDWHRLIRRVLWERTRVRLTDVALSNAGQTSIVDVIVYPVQLGGVGRVAIVLRDVTERNRLEQEARRAEAMSATVTVARGVAHDFTNLLTSATGSLRGLRGNTGDPVVEDRLARALRACGQAAGLSRKLLDFASGDPGHPQRISLRETVELILDSVDEALMEGIRIERELDPNVHVCMDGDQLTQIVLNLIYNAREAMLDGGVMTVTVGMAIPGDVAGAATNEMFARLAVQDTGLGMTDDVRARLFEPFFSTKTKEDGHSRGMGMAIVYSAVRNARGFIQVDSAASQGTTIHVYIPRDMPPGSS